MAVRSTKAYIRYRSETVALLDFAVFVSYAVPALRNDIVETQAGTRASLFPPDFFHKSNVLVTLSELLTRESTYEKKLAAYTLLTHFSFFESFVADVILEMIDFHGGADQFTKRIEAKMKRFMAPHPPDVAKLKRKLQDSETPAKHEKYRKYARQLAGYGFRFPGELLAAYGVRTLTARIQRLKAVEIPDLLVHALQLDLSDAERNEFHRIRKIRNRIAHGQPSTLSMTDSMKMNKALRQLAIRISDHLLENYFVIEKYSP
jgi:hypothetical protein